MLTFREAAPQLEPGPGCDDRGLEPTSGVGQEPDRPRKSGRTVKAPERFCPEDGK